MNITSHKYNLAQYIRKNDPDLYASICEMSGNTFAEKYYRHIRPGCGVCEACGRPTKFINITKGFRRFCSPQCSNSNQSKIDKTIKTNLQKYGTISSAQSQEVKDKAAQTCLKRYGTISSAQSQEVKDKTRANNLQKYGCHPSQLLSTRQKISASAFERHMGCDPSIIGVKEDKLIITCPHPECRGCEDRLFEIDNINYYNRRNYNCEICTRLFPVGSVMRGVSIKSQQFFDRIDKHFERFTTHYASKNKEYNIGHYKLDYYIEELQVAIEYNGAYFHADPTIYKPDDIIQYFNTTKTAHEIWSKDIDRMEYLISLGIDVYVVWENREDEFENILKDIQNKYV